MKNVRVFEAFAGYGSQAMALKRLQLQYTALHFDFVGISEIDSNALKAYKAVHGDIPNFGDILKINWEGVPDFDLFTYSFPCTDISLAGLMKGLEEGSGTRSSLLWECKRAIIQKLPKYLLMENVSNLQAKKFLPYLEKWEDFLESLGYTNYRQVLDSKDYGIPQTRKRLFLVSFLGEHKFRFPKKHKERKDIVELLDHCYGTNKTPFLNNAPDIFNDKEFEAVNLSIDGCCKTLKAQYHKNGVANILRGGSFGCTGVVEKGKLRKLSARECFRLMGVSDDDIDKIQSTGMCRTWQYQLSGNSIVVDLLYDIFKNMFVDG